jgi:hypothetical protein
LFGEETEFSSRLARVPGDTISGYLYAQLQSVTQPPSNGGAPSGPLLRTTLRTNITPTFVVASIGPELLESLIDMEKIDVDSVEDCTDANVMDFPEFRQEHNASVSAEFVKAEVLAKVLFAISENDPALRVMKTVAD